MGASIAGIAEYFGTATVAEGAAAGAAEGAVVDVGATAGVAGGTAASGGGALAAQGAYAAETEALFGAQGGGGSFLGALGKAAATAAVTAGVQQGLAPRRPDLPKQLPMPDAQAQEQARKRQIIEATARRGRASTILTDGVGGGTLGG